MGQLRVGVSAAGTRATDVFLRVDALKKAYAARNGTNAALAEVTFSVKRGEFVSVVGSSGCGKSTLLKIILGVVPSSGGEIQIDGRTVRGPQVDVGMVFQTPALLPWRSVLDNVLLPVQVLRRPRSEFVERAKQLLLLAGLGGFEGAYPRELSGGMQQRVAICRALIHDPGLLLMDEPFGALDALTRESMQTELLRIWEETSKLILFVTHSIDEAVLLSDRVLLMSPRPGRIDLVLDIALPRPRTPAIRASAQFQEYALSLRRGLGIATDV
jgi:NitT/TauT family transport system ATP-binding protein